jgi:hypothetical protein
LGERLVSRHRPSIFSWHRVYRSSFVQARGALNKELLRHLRSKRRFVDLGRPACTIIAQQKRVFSHAMNRSALLHDLPMAAAYLSSSTF